MGFVSKKTSVEVVLDLEEFLNERFSMNDVNPDLLNRDLLTARGYYAIFSEMRRNAKDLRLFFYFSPVEGPFEGNCMIVDSDGGIKRREVDFEEIKQFSDYLVREYNI